MGKFLQNKKFMAGIAVFSSVVLLVIYLKMSGTFPDFSMVKMYRMDVEVYLMKNLLAGIIVFALIYISAIALSLPIATPLTILSGFLFGNIIGTGVVAVSATIGATLALIIIRFFFRDYVKEKFSGRLAVVNNELRGHGFRDILLLRLTPLMPFSLINIAAALTAVRVEDFFFATLLGTIPFTFIYVNAGTQISMIDSIGDIVSLPVLLGISLLVVVVSIPLLKSRRTPQDRSHSA